MSTISLSEAKEFLKIDYTSQDTVLQLLIDGAEEWVERFCGIALTQGTHTDSFIQMVDITFGRQRDPSLR